MVLHGTCDEVAYKKKWGTLEFNVRISYIALFLKSCAFVGKSWAKVCSILSYNANFFLLLEEEKTDSTGLQIGTFFWKMNLIKIRNRFCPILFNCRSNKP